MQAANSSTNLGKFFQLDNSQRKTLLKALVLLPGTAIQLALTGYKSTLRSCAAVNPSKAPARSAKDLECAKDLARLVNIAAAHGPYRALCLVRSLTLLRMMSSRGLEGNLVLGARREEQTIAAHAWVLFHGQVINDVVNVEQSYSRFHDAGEVRE
jgi:hypothetical protein